MVRLICQHERTEGRQENKKNGRAQFEKITFGERAETHGEPWIHIQKAIISKHVYKISRGDVEKYVFQI